MPSFCTRLPDDVVTAAPLRVAFDVTPAISGGTGIARYVNQLGAALEQRGAELRRFAVGRPSFPVPARTRRLPVPARWLVRWWSAVPWPTAEGLVGGADLVHATGLLIPPTRGPLVVTVHDIAAVLYPDLHPARHVRQSRSQLAALEKAAAVLTVSQATACDLARLGVPQDRLVVAPLGVTPLPEGEPVRGLPARYVLTVGETSPRKGYGVLLHALSRLEPDLTLVMAGPPAGDEPRLRSLADKLDVRHRVSRLGAVSDATLAGVYSGAIALCFPSIAEGFGLPVLEAMAAGLPVITSDIPVARELAGDGALYVKGADADGWTQAISELVGDEALRQRLSAQARTRAATYTWERTARATLEAYRLALDAAGSGSEP